MMKLLPFGLALLATVAFVVWNLSGSSIPTLTLPSNFSISQAGQKVAISSGTLEDRVKELEFAVSDLLNKSKVANPTASPASPTSPDLKSLQTSVDDLKTRIIKLESNSTTTTGTSTGSTSSSSSTGSSTGAKIAYIPIGYTGSGNAGDYTNISGQEVTIDSANYPGYKSMTLEVNFRIFQNGTGYVRLLNKTDGTAILSSVISTTATDYTTLSSSSFTIASGSKTYVVQAKSSTGYSVDLQWSRLRVDF